MADETPYWADEATTRARVDAGDLTVGLEEVAALLAIIDRLRAREAARMAIVREVAGMSVEDGIYDQPFYALMSHVHETDEQWHQQLVTQARSLLAQE